MQRERLTNERIKRFSCLEGKAQTFFWDAEVPRLGIRVTSTGAKAFILERKLNGATIRWTIGQISDWTIEAARKEARRLQTQIDQGIDPREQEAAKKAENAAKRAAVEANRKYTLKALLEAYIDHLKARGKVKSANQVLSVCRVHVLDIDPMLANKAAQDITSIEIAALIRRTYETGKARTAGVLRTIIAAAYNCARRAPFDTELPSIFIQFNIDKNPVDIIPTIPIRTRNRVLSHAELKNYVEALGDGTVDLALKLALYSGGQRMAQLLRAEISDWNPDARILRLEDPKGKRRQPREHLLPLATTGTAIVNQLLERAKSIGTNKLFRSTMKNATLHEALVGPRISKIVKKIGSEPFDLRDIRRTVETELAALGVSRDIRAQLLSHGISGVQAQHYDRHDYLKEKTLALRKWEQHLSRILTGEKEQKIIQLRG